ncbi:phosphoribosylglycinamide formyltransferase, partial [Escherichia coli]|nr:phosphoribosylglycinamide formyltransferase [Escherichia coli]
GKGMWGMNVHKAVLEAGEKETGATVHFVTSGIDEGDIILQDKVEITPNDTAESIAAKVHEIEYKILPKAVEMLLK